MFELLSDPTLLFTLLFAGFLAGFIDAIAGGGGLLTVPVLLTSGLPPHIALGTNKLSACFGSFTASLTFYRKRLFVPSFWVYAAISTAFGALMGTILVNLINAALLQKVLPIIILSCAVYTLFAKGHINSSQMAPVKSKLMLLKQSLQGFTLGFYDGAAGPGTGAFWLTSSLALYKMDILLSSGLSRSMNFISNFVSLITFVILGQVHFGYGLAMGVFMLFGSWLGAHSAIKFGAKFIRPVFIVVVLLLTTNLAYKAWF